MNRHVLSVTLLALCLAAAAFADDVRTETARFEKGTSGTKIEDHLTGYESVQYLLGASEGQSMKVEMTTDNGSAYFNVFAPGKTAGKDEAMFVGSTSGLSFRPSFHHHRIGALRGRGSDHRWRLNRERVESETATEIGASA